MYTPTRLVSALGVVAAVATLGTAVPATAAPAPAPTQAIPVACPTPIGVVPAPDVVRIELVNHDFGDGNLVDNAPNGCGTLTWDLANGTITPRLTGTLFAKNAIGTTVRMRLRHRDVDGTLLATTTGASKLVTSNDVQEFPITLGNYSNPLIYRVDVELQQLIGGQWTTQGTEREHIGSSSKAADAVRILAVGQDFGDGPFANGQPSGSGLLTWDLANGTITPRLTGDLYLFNSAGTEVRMRLRHYDVHGNRLRTVNGATHEAQTNALETFPIDLAGFSNPEIYKVTVNLMVDVGGTWTSVGSTATVTI